MKKVICGFILLFLLFTVSFSHAIDTGDWENVSLAVAFSNAEPNKEWLVNTLFWVGRKRPKNIDKYYYEKSNTIIFPYENNWHDLTEFMVSYQKAEKGGYYYFVSFKLKKGVMTTLDVISRYGTNLATIKTNEDLSREISFLLTSDMESLVGETPLWPLRPRNPGQITRVSFIAKDKVFIDELAITTYKP